VFCTGTAVVVVPVGSITYKGEKKLYKDGAVGPVALQMYTRLTDLQVRHQCNTTTSQPGSLIIRCDSNVTPVLLEVTYDDNV
jgi:hypothetical protein